MAPTNFLARIRALTGERTAVNEEWQSTIRAALRAGESAADVADAAGISTSRVYQIRDYRR